MNPALVTLGGLGLIGLIVTVVVVAIKRGELDALFDLTYEDDRHE